MYSELRTVLEYIVAKIAEHQLVDLYKGFAQLYEQIRTSPSPEVSEQLAQRKKDIQKVQELIQPKDWDVIKLKIWKDFNAEAFLGTSGFDKLESELNQCINDPAGASKVADNFANEIEGIRQRAERAVGDLGGLLVAEEEIKKGRKLQLVFDNKVAVNDFSNLELQAKEWSKILKILRQVSNTPDEEAKLYKIYKSSPTVIVIDANPTIISLTIFIVKEALDIFKKLWEIRKFKALAKAAEMESEYYDQIIGITEKAEKKKLNRLVSESARRIVADHGLKGNAAEVSKTASGAVIKKIYNFTVNGGAVNLVDGNIKKGDITIFQSELASTYEKAREMLQDNAEPLRLAEFTEIEERKVEELAVEKIKKEKKNKSKKGKLQKKIKKSTKKKA